ncbi:MAG: hypothetical protein LBB36_05215 [Fibromonadaceae bacterium]|jgi:hypothetical protein|nr:hypothetical protein [Fibromonadaceae bacterium]
MGWTIESLLDCSTFTLELLELPALSDDDESRVPPDEDDGDSLSLSLTLEQDRMNVRANIKIAVSRKRVAFILLSCPFGAVGFSFPVSFHRQAPGNTELGKVCTIWCRFLSATLLASLAVALCV